MSPSQITPLEAAAYHLNNIKAGQLHAMDVATTLVERLPFAALSFNIASLRHNRRFEWGVMVSVHAVDASLFPQLAAELNGQQKTDVHSVGVDEVVTYETLVGSLAGVPFEIRAYIGSQRVQVVAA